MSDLFWLYRKFQKFKKKTRCRLRELEQKESRNMSRIQEVEDLIGQFKNVTDNLAAEITDLQNQIKNGMTPAEVDQVKADLQTKIDALKALGTNPNNPTDTTSGSGGVDTVVGGTGTAP